MTKVVVLQVLITLDVLLQKSPVVSTNPHAYFFVLPSLHFQKMHLYNIMISSNDYIFSFFLLAGILERLRNVLLAKFPPTIRL